MRRHLSALTLGALLATVAGATSAHGHASYNIAGYGSGLGGSTNGSDGLPGTGVSSIWSNGDPISTEYVGGLPVHWYAGMHSTTDVRTIQTGSAVNPPNGSLAQQIATYNGANDPDLPIDRVLGVGGLSWSDPGNGNQGWGHGLDYGLLHYSPIDTLLADGPIRVTVALQDDPSDGVAPQLAMAIYGGWDTNAASSRHQTFTTSPVPVNNPLGSGGLTLLDFAVATGPGRPISRSFNLDTAYGGEYTILVGALGGVAGQYQLTVTTSPDLELEQCLLDLASAGADDDADGVGDAEDACPATPAATEVDTAGCSKAQFCSAIDAAEPKVGKKNCTRGDWKNDQPIMNLNPKKGEVDCLFNKNGKGTADDTCTAAP